MISDTENALPRSDKTSGELTRPQHASDSNGLASVDMDPHEADRPAAPKRPSRVKRAVLIGAAAVALLAGGTYGARMWQHARVHEDTDDAFVEGHVIALATKSAGYVQAVAVDDNQHVNKGELLVQIDPRDYEARLAQERASLQAAESQVAAAKTNLDALRANVGSAKSELTAAEANLEYASSEAQRFAQMGQDAASWQERHTTATAARAQAATVDAARSKLAATEAQVANGESAVRTAEAQVAVAQTKVRQAELDLSYTKIVAPETGRVTRKNVEPGAYVSVGQALLAVVPDEVWVVANFKETQLDQMRAGQPVEVKVDAYPDHRFKAHVDSIQSGTGARFSMLPPENATGNYVKVVQRVPVKIVFDEKLPAELNVAPGMSVVPEVKVK